MTIKKISIFALCGTLAILLAGCSKKTIMEVSFAHYSFQRNTNNKSYTAVASESPAIIYQAQQVTTGTANSLVISQIELPANTVLQDVQKLNADQLSKKLLAYKSLSSSQQNVMCSGVRLTGYATTFSYELDVKQKFSVYQYYFMENTILYLISFQADNTNDISTTAKSIKSLVCK